MLPFIARTRRNHAAEHATIHLLNRRYPSLRVLGWSTPAGFYIYGHVPPAAVESAVSEALSRLRQGERHLALHPRCGTNLVTAGSLVGLVAFLAMLPGSRRSRQSRLPLIMLLATLVLTFAQPLGLKIQEHITTDAHHLDQVEATIQHGTAGATPVHWVKLHRREHH